MTYDFDLFVIGGGSAGVRCARIAAGHGARVAVAEERFWGGTCVNIGCVPKKLLVQAGEYGAWADDAAGFGWDIQKNGHDWSKLIAAKDAEITRLNGIYRKLMAGCTTFDAREPVKIGNQTIHDYDAVNQVLNLEQIAHFASRGALDIEGLGEQRQEIIAA